VKKPFSILKTNRLLLREIVDSDIENIYKGLSNPKVIKHYGVSFDSLEATKEQMNWYAEKEQLWWTICALNNKMFYGAAGLNAICTDQKKAEIGLWLLPDFWGKGIMTEIFPLITNYAFSSLNLKRIEGFVETENQNCINAMSKLDFILEETIPHYDTKTNTSINVHLYSKTK